MRAVRTFTRANSAATKKPFNNTKNNVAPSRHATPSQSSAIDSLTRAIASREHSAAAFGLGHAIDAAHQRGRPQIDAVLTRDAPHVLEGTLHQPDQPVVHLLLAPEELLEALHPFEIGDGHPARV